MLERFRWWLVRLVQPKCQVRVAIRGRPMLTDDIRDLVPLDLVHLDECLPYLTPRQQADPVFREKLMLGDAAVREREAMTAYPETLERLKAFNEAVQKKRGEEPE